MAKAVATAGVAAGAAGVAIAAFGVKKQFTAIDEVAKLSDQLGIGTEKLLGLRHAAELTGAGAGSLDKGLGTLSKRIGEAARGSGAATAALGELGLSASELSEIGIGPAFDEIAGALEKVENPIKRNAIAANLFSKANMGLLNTLALGKEGLADVQAEAERLGMTYSRDAARKVEEANDAMLKIRSSFTGMFSTMAIASAPFVTKWSDKITEGAANLHKPLGKAIELAYKGGVAFKMFATATYDAFEGFGAIALSALSLPFEGMVGGSKSAFGAIVENLDVMLGSWDGFAAGVANVGFQIRYSLEAIWEQTANAFRVTWAGAGAWWNNFWADMQTSVTEQLAPMLSRLAIRVQKFRVEAAGGTWVNTPQEDEATAVSAAAEAVRAIETNRLASEAATNDKLAALREKHEAIMKGIGDRSLAATALWANQMFTMPKLSETLEGKWAEFTAMTPGSAASAVSAAAGEEEPPPAPAAASRPQFAGAMLQGSTEAYSTIINASRPENAIASRHLSVAEQSLTQLQGINASATAASPGDTGGLLAMPFEAWDNPYAPTADADAARKMAQQRRDDTSDADEKKTWGVLRTGSGAESGQGRELKELLRATSQQTDVLRAGFGKIGKAETVSIPAA